jgi:SAM-dependent methyltransferase
LCEQTKTWSLARYEHRATLFRCRGCGVAFANFADSPADNSTAPEQDHFQGLDLKKYLRSVGATRLSSYDHLLKRVAKFVPQGRWLDVGCSYGWLLKFLGERGYEGVGIEPSGPAAQAALDVGLHVRTGYYPEALAAEERFDAISFMDVLEHFAHPREVLARTAQHLSPGGVVVIQVPDQACLLYRLAEQLYRCSGGRVGFALRRLWLIDFDFPHQFYYTRATLAKLLDQAGYDVLDCCRQSIGSPLQAISRVGYAQSQTSAATTAVVGAAVGAINAVDWLTGYGGLLTFVARPRQ